MRHKVAPLVPFDLLGSDPAYSLDIASLHLADIDAGIQRISDVMEDIRPEDLMMTREDIEVTVENGTLVLKGQKKFDTEVKEEHYRRIERSYGQFFRSFTLPNTVDTSKVAADYKNGILTVKLPFREEAKPRTISVDVAA